MKKVLLWALAFCLAFSALFPSVLFFSASAESAPTVKSMKDMLARLPKEQNKTLSFETDDVEIRTFVGGLKRRRRLRRIALAAAVAAALLAAALVAALALR